MRRHLAALVDSGLVLRRDSPNGKRYARKTTSGDIGQAFGFDLGPIVARSDEFAALAEVAIAKRQALAILRERITLARRDIAKMIATGVEQGVAADWASYYQTFRDIMARLPRPHVRNPRTHPRRTGEPGRGDRQRPRTPTRSDRAQPSRPRRRSDSEFRPGEAEPIRTEASSRRTGAGRAAPSGWYNPYSHGGRTLSRYRRLRARRHSHLSGSYYDGIDRAPHARHPSQRLGRSLHSNGRLTSQRGARCHPATRRGPQESRRISQNPGTARCGWGILGLANADGATPPRVRRMGTKPHPVFLPG